MPVIHVELMATKAKKPL